MPLTHDQGHAQQAATGDEEGCCQGRCRYTRSQSGPGFSQTHRERCGSEAGPCGGRGDQEDRVGANGKMPASALGSQSLNVRKATCPAIEAALKETGFVQGGTDSCPSARQALLTSVKRVVFNLKLCRETRPGRCEMPRANINGLSDCSPSFVAIRFRDQHRRL